jgi:hypothetical protein
MGPWELDVAVIPAASAEEEVSVFRELAAERRGVFAVFTRGDVDLAAVIEGLNGRCEVLADSGPWSMRQISSLVRRERGDIRVLVATRESAGVWLPWCDLFVSVGEEVHWEAFGYPGRIVVIGTGTGRGNTWIQPVPDRFSKVVMLERPSQLGKELRLRHEFDEVIVCDPRAIAYALQQGGREAVGIVRRSTSAAVDSALGRLPDSVFEALVVGQPLLWRSVLSKVSCQRQVGRFLGIAMRLPGLSPRHACLMLETGSRSMDRRLRAVGGICGIILLRTWRLRGRQGEVE